LQAALAGQEVDRGALWHQLVDSQVFGQTCWLFFLFFEKNA